MLCAISGEAPQIPVASRKSGNVFEKRLIEAYISEHGKDPVNGEELTTDDLVDLKSARVVKPRPPALTSIPSLLATFQNEWDALALETYSLKQQLAQTRQELSTALYQHDAAVRVIARLTRERDEARDALSKISISAGGAVSNGDQMQVDGQGLPEALAAKVDSTQEKLSKSRRKRAIPEDWATSESIESFSTTITSTPLFPGGRSITVDPSGDLVLVGGANGNAGVFSLSQNALLQTFSGDGASITDGLWAGGRAIVATASGTVKVFENASEKFTFKSHAGAATGLALHPSGDILASVGMDKSIVYYDLVAGQPVTQVFTDAALTTAAFHPDGHLFAAGGTDGQIKVFEVKTGNNAANFEMGGVVQDLSFSENGTWLAAATKGQTSVSIWDLRKATRTKVLETGSEVTSIRWDYSAQFLAAAGPGGITVQQYSKSTKQWSQPLRSAVPSLAVDWGSRGGTIVSVSGDGVVHVFGTE